MGRSTFNLGHTRLLVAASTNDMEERSVCSLFAWKLTLERDRFLHWKYNLLLQDSEDQLRHSVLGTEQMLDSQSFC